MENKNIGKPKLSKQELEARKKLLDSETIEQRTKRVLNPRLNKLFKQFDMLISSFNSPRYKLSVEQGNVIIGELEKMTIALKTSFDKKTKTDVKNIL